MINKNTADKYTPVNEGRKGKLRLDFNENTLGCSSKVITAIKNITAEDLAAYPEYVVFKKKLAKYLKVNVNNLMLTNGADEAISLVFNAYLNKAANKPAEIIIPTPSFEMLNVYAQNLDAKTVSIPYKKTDNSFIFPTEVVLATINTKTQLVVLVNPNNPTGTAIDKEDILKIIQKAKKNNTIVLIDEAYYEFYGRSFLGLLNKYNNLIIIRTFSKAFGLAGLRLGYAIADKNRINEIRKISSPYNVNSLAVIAADTALDDTRFVKKYVKEVNQSKKYIESELNKSGIKTFKSEANFLIADFGESSKKVISGLAKAGILVRDRSKIPLLQNCVRMTIGTKEQSSVLIDEIKKILGEKVILFDLDGVLVDVKNSYRLTIKKTAEFFAKQKITYKEIQSFKEKGGYNNDWDLTEAIISSKGARIKKQDIIKKFQEFYLGNKKKKGLINNEAWLLDKNLLKNLYKKYRLGIVTGRPKEEAYYVLKKFKVLGFFDAVIAMEDCGKKQKPNPFGINLALKRLNLAKANKKSAIYIGDNIDDIKAAKNAGIKSIGILSSNINSKSLKKPMINNGAIKILNDINKLASVIT